MVIYAVEYIFEYQFAIHLNLSGTFYREQTIYFCCVIEKGKIRSKKEQIFGSIIIDQKKTFCSFRNERNINQLLAYHE
jgi:hypothetical protein